MKKNEFMIPKSQKYSYVHSLILDIPLFSFLKNNILTIETRCINDDNK